MSAVVPVVIVLAVVVGIVGGYSLRLAIDDKSKSPTDYGLQLRLGTVLVIVSAMLLLALAAWNPDRSSALFVALVPTAAIGVGGGCLLTYAQLNKIRWDFNEAAHRRDLERIDANKAARSRAELEHEIALTIRQLAHDIDFEKLRETSREQMRVHATWKRFQDRIDNIVKAAILAKAELRDSPLLDDILRELQRAQAMADTINPDNPQPVNKERAAAQFEMFAMEWLRNRFDNKP